MERIQKNPAKSWLHHLSVVRDYGAVDTVQYYSHYEQSTVKTVVAVCEDMITTVHGLEIELGREIIDSSGAFSLLSAYSLHGPLKLLGESSWP